jgi:glutathione S-transferase
MGAQAGKASLVLYAEENWDSPFVFTAFVALEEKKVPFEVRVVDLSSREQKAPAYVEKFALGRVPALEHGDFRLTESLAIAEYLEEAFPSPRIFPADVRDRARARMVLLWLRTDLHALREDRPTTTMFYAKASRPLTPAGVAARDRLVGVSSSLLPEGRAYLFGDFSIADADLAFMLQRLVANDDPVPERLAAYARRVWERPSVRAFVAMPRPKHA